MKNLIKLQRTERVCWVMLLVVIFLLFHLGIKIQYEFCDSIGIDILQKCLIPVLFIDVVMLAKTIERENKIKEELK